MDAGQKWLSMSKDKGNCNLSSGIITALSGAPWVRKFAYLSKYPRNFGT